MDYKAKRAELYNQQIPVGDQLDAILKAFDYLIQNEVLPYNQQTAHLFDIVDAHAMIKQQVPKS